MPTVEHLNILKCVPLNLVDIFKRSLCTCFIYFCIRVSKYHVFDHLGDNVVNKID